MPHASRWNFLSFIVTTENKFLWSGGTFKAFCSSLTTKISIHLLFSEIGFRSRRWIWRIFLICRLWTCLHLNWLTKIFATHGCFWVRNVEIAEVYRGFIWRFSTQCAVTFAIFVWVSWLPVTLLFTNRTLCSFIQIRNFFLVIELW